MLKVWFSRLSPDGPHLLPHLPTARRSFSSRHSLPLSLMLRLYPTALILFLLLVNPLAAQDVRFNRDIRPLLSDRCFHCHGPDEGDRQAGLRLDQATGPEGAYELAIEPGSIENSELWHRITSDDPDLVMPPPDSHKLPLSDQEKQQFRQWIEQGAAYESFWAFVPPQFPELPREIEGPPIDRFVLRRLAEVGLQPTAPADKRTLIRRLSLDLTGLPPTRQEIKDFLDDDTAQAYEKLVDRLLASPHYGEHMAKYWLDLVRFADTNGIHHDHYREMTPYRDWVIRAFNDNLPYDEFTRYQLAGDLYPQPTRDQWIASGFNRLHLIIDRGTALPEESFFRNVNDRVAAVGTAFLGLTVQCAICHDHKYDPLTIKDYYSLFAFFNNIDAEPETGGRSGTDFLRGLQPPFINLPSTEQAIRLAELNAELAAAEARLSGLKAALQEPQQGEAEKKGIEALVQAAEQTVQATLRSRDEHLMTIPAAMIMKELPEVRPTSTFLRGEYDKPGDHVTRRTPAFLLPMKNDGELVTRMDLADWFTDPSHPLTARVAVNRFWQQLFGVGIVRTSEDFGAQGEWPSHPEVLDYLASQFVASGWNVRALMKEIVMSATYQRSSQAPTQLFQRDPRNRLLARGARFRLDAEQIRDQVLATSGLLSRTMYGRSVKPPQPAGLWTAVGMPSSYPKSFDPDTGENAVRRSLYTFWKRAMPPPQMTILNAPSREECTARRERTNTPLQALLLLNEPEYLNAARHLAADELQAKNLEPSQLVKAIYERITANLPDETQQQTLLHLAMDLQQTYEMSPELADQLCGDHPLPTHLSPAQLAAWTMVASAVYNLDITKTRQ